MFNPPEQMQYWQVVEDIVRSKGRELQRYIFFEKVWEAIDRDINLIVIRAPTNSGKTEAASAPFLRDLKLGKRRWLSLIHVLPTRSLVNSMRRRYAEAVGALKIKNAVISYEYGQLIGVRSYLDGDIVVTTYDTMLHRFYGTDLNAPHIIGQVSKIVNSLVVMDEVQLLQDEYWYAMSLLPHHIAALLKCGVQIILMTATLPTVVLEIIKKKTSENLQNTISEELISSPDKPVRGKISLELRNDEIPSSQDQLVQLIREHYPGKGSVLIITNTVEKAVSIYSSLFKAYFENTIDLKPLLLHSRLRQGVRRDIEEFLGSEENKKFILVATQVVEAGLDIDSTLLLTEISPVDSLIQRIGRCGRRQDSIAIVYTRSEGALKVYPKSLVERTRSTIDEDPDLLAESPGDLKAAQILLDKVFDSEIINLLMRYTERSHKVIEWIDKYWISSFDIGSWAAHVPPDHILRLGIELPSYKPSLSEYGLLLREEKLEIKVEDLEKNLVRLTVRGTDEPAMPALLHEVNGNYYYICIELITEENHHIRLVPTRTPAGKISKIFSEIVKGKVLLLNPEFYEITSFGSELGVVKPWKKA